MARDNKGFSCHVHRYMVSYEIHHIWPTCYHGPNIAANKVKICPNAHSDVHYLMERMLRNKPYNRREYGHSVFDLAAAGWAAVISYADTLLLQQYGDLEL